MWAVYRRLGACSTEDPALTGKPRFAKIRLRYDPLRNHPLSRTRYFHSCPMTFSRIGRAFARGGTLNGGTSLPVWRQVFWTLNFRYLLSFLTRYLAARPA